MKFSLSKFSKIRSGWHFYSLSADCIPVNTMLSFILSGVHSKAMKMMICRQISGMPSKSVEQQKIIPKNEYYILLLSCVVRLLLFKMAISIPKNITEKRESQNF